MKCFFCLLSFFMICIRAQTQSCSYFPADCPGDMNSKDPVFCQHRFIVDKEIIMQDQIRDMITGLMEKQAKTNNWEVYEFDEDADGASIKPPNDNEESYPVPYPHRAPHAFTICFVFIVNSDSLKAWQYWYNNVMMPDATRVGNEYQSTLNDPSFQSNQKTYMDSANYWTMLQTDYMTKNMESYQKAAVNGDQAGIHQYENAVKQFQAHVTYWTDKAVNGVHEATAAPDADHNRFKNDASAKRTTFRNSSMIRVKFIFNNDDAYISESENMHFVKQIQVPNTSLAQLYHNTKINDVTIYQLNEFDRNTDAALLLLGNWSVPSVGLFRYHAAFALDKKNMDKFSEKKIPCDKLQTISVSVEGSVHYINEFLKSLDAVQLNKQILQ
jgi:hypothetical protein